jgi:hypothetical protein
MKTMNTSDKIRSLINPRLREIHGTIQGVLSMGDLAVYVGQPMQDAMEELAQFVSDRYATEARLIQYWTERYLDAIAICMREPAGGEFFTLRKLANDLGLFVDDLDGERVIPLIAEYLRHTKELPVAPKL